MQCCLITLVYSLRIPCCTSLCLQDKVVVYYLLRTSDPVSEEQANDLCREVIARLQACCRCGAHSSE